MLTAAGRAAAEKDDGDDDEPNPVVVKEIAEAVVIHSVYPFEKFIVESAFCLPNIIICELLEDVTDNCKILSIFLFV